MNLLFFKSLSWALPVFPESTFPEHINFPKIIAGYKQGWPIYFSEKYIQENVFGQTSFYPFHKKLVREKLLAPDLCTSSKV